MRRAIIVHNCDNDSLLYFTQTKLFYNAKNEGLNGYFNHCITVDNHEQAYNIATNNDLILETGDFITTSYRGIHQRDKEVHNIVSCLNKKGHEECVIKFNQDWPIDFKKRRYQQGSKQLYIIENLLKTVLISKGVIYLENTDRFAEIRSKFYRLFPGPGSMIDYSSVMKNMKHFYGLASGWKTMIHAVKNNYESVTVYDVNQRQLDFAKMLYKEEILPESIHGGETRVSASDILAKLGQPWESGNYTPTEFVKDNWHIWHNMDVKFELINLFDIPRFKPNSLVWTSNVYHYEASLFEHGYDFIKDRLIQLTQTNSDCIIVTDT